MSEVIKAKAKLYCEGRVQQILEEAGILKDEYAIEDFGLTGSESDAELIEIAHDFISECDSDKVEYEMSRRFPQGDDMNGDETW